MVGFRATNRALPRFRLASARYCVVEARLALSRNMLLTNLASGLVAVTVLTGAVRNAFSHWRPGAPLPLDPLVNLVLIALGLSLMTVAYCLFRLTFGGKGPAAALRDANGGSARPERRRGRSARRLERLPAARRIDKFTYLLRPLGLVEMSRTGVLSIERGEEAL